MSKISSKRDPVLPDVQVPSDVVMLPPTETAPDRSYDAVVLYYIGDGLHAVPGLPTRDLTQYDIDTSPYKDDPSKILKFTPAVFATGAKSANDAEGQPIAPDAPAINSPKPPLPHGGLDHTLD